MITKLLKSNVLKSRHSGYKIPTVISSPCSAPKLRQLNYDTFMKLSDVTESFCVNRVFKNAIQGINVYETKFRVNPLFKKVKVINQPELTKSLNNLFKELPGFFNIFTPVRQYRGNLYKHVLGAFQILLKNPDYQRLSSREQKLLEIATLLHDMGKTKVAGSAHIEESVKIADKMLKSKSLPEKDKNLISKIVKHHHFSENVDKKKMTTYDYAKILTEEEFKLLKILVDSDIKSKRKPVQWRLDSNVRIFAEQDATFKAMRNEA